MKLSNWISRENIEWAAQIYFNYIRNRPLTRYGALLFLGSLALYSNVLQLFVLGLFLLLGKQLTIPDVPEGIFYAMIAVGGVLIVLDRLLPERTMLPTAYPHDEQLMRTIRGVYTEDVDDFLRLHAFGNGSFLSDILKPLFTFCSWRGSQYEFINAETNEAWTRVRDAAKNLLNEVAEKTISARGSVSRITPFRDDEDHDWHTPEMISRFDGMDAAANKLVEEWDRFDALARRKIPNVV